MELTVSETEEGILNLLTQTKEGNTESKQYEKWNNEFC